MNRLVRRGVIAPYLLLSCAPVARYEAPASLRNYAILVPRGDSLGLALVAALRRRGFTVRRRVKGGSGPTAALITFRFAELDSTRAPTPWLHVRLADTRSGAIVAAVSAPDDSFGPTPAAKAQAIADSLRARVSRRRAGS